MAAKRVFFCVNSICIHLLTQFDKHRPIVIRNIRGHNYVLSYLQKKKPKTKYDAYLYNLTANNFLSDSGVLKQLYTLILSFNKVMFLFSLQIWTLPTMRPYFLLRRYLHRRSLLKWRIKGKWNIYIKLLEEVYNPCCLQNPSGWYNCRLMTRKMYMYQDQ